MSEAHWSTPINALLYRIQRQDKTALHALYSECSSRLLSIISRIIHDNSEAEDVLQEVFVKVWGQANQYSGSGSAWGWLCVLTRNSALDRIRSLNARPHLSIEDQEGVLDKLFTEENLSDTHSLQCCLNKLKENARQSILLAYVYGLSHSELSQKMSAPLGSIKAWVRRGLQELKLCLGH